MSSTGAGATQHRNISSIQGRKPEAAQEGLDRLNGRGTMAATEDGVMEVNQVR